MEKTESPLPLSTTDWLAIERTKLANERTFLAYFRTAFAILAGGITIVRLEVLQDIRALGYLFILLAPVVFFIGLWRMFSVKRRIERYYNR